MTGSYDVTQNGHSGAGARSLIADVPTPAMPVWSPDGLFVAYLWDTGAGWQVRVTGAAGEQPVASATGAALFQIDWSRDGHEVIFTRRSEGGIHVAALDITSGSVRSLTQGRSDRSPQVSPDGATVAFISGRSGSLDIWKVPISGGAVTQLTEHTNPLDEPRWTPRWSPDGNWIAYISSRSGERNNDDAWIVSADGREHRQLSTGLIVNTDPVWSPGGTSVAVIANTEVEHWYGDDSDLWIVHLDDVRPHRVHQGALTRGIEGGGVAWSPDGEVIYCLEHDNGNTNLAAVRVADGLLTRITNLAGVIRDFSIAPGGDSFALITSAQTEPPELAVLAAEGGMPVPLTNASAAIDVAIAPPIRMPFRTHDGIYCDAYLYLPAGFSTGRRYPALVQVHGGGTNSFGNGWHPIEQFLAQRGFIILAIEYRGSSGYGRDFAGLSYADWGGGQTRDAVAAAAFLRSKAYVSGVGIYGQSFGGYLSLHSIVAAPDAFDAAADLYGITNRFDYFDRSDRVGRVFVMRDYGGRGPHDAPQAYLQASTHHRLGEIRTPLLVLHGSEDRRVPPVQSEAVVEQLRQHGVEHDFVVYPGEGHGFRERAHRIDAYERLAAWFERHLGGEQAIES